MDPETIAVYDAAAATYQANRPPRATDRAAALVHGVDAPVLDLAAAHGHPLARGDLGRLPVRPGSLGAAWARNSYLHVAHEDLPLALAELHRSLRVGAPVSCSFLPGPDDRVVSDDDLPGRRFWRWTDDRLTAVFAGAGFADVRLSGEQPRFVDARRARTLADTVGPGMRLLVCGLNPSLHAADAGVGFVTPSNRFWRAAIEAGLVTRPRDPWHAIRSHGVGMTDLVKRATRRADELSAAEYRAGVERVERLCAWLRPGAVLCVGLAGWRAAVDRRAGVGVQERRLGGRPVYAMPSTSGLNARTPLNELIAHLRAAAALADSTR